MHVVFGVGQLIAIEANHRCPQQNAKAFIGGAPQRFGKVLESGFSGYRFAAQCRANQLGDLGHVMNGAVPHLDKVDVAVHFERSSKIRRRPPARSVFAAPVCKPMDQCLHRKTCVQTVYRCGLTGYALGPQLAILEGKVLAEPLQIFVDEAPKLDKGGTFGSQPAGLLGLVTVDELNPVPAFALRFGIGNHRHPAMVEPRFPRKQGA
ncbi:hypothetical protein D3C84_539200 [compost metagenome]